MIVLVRVNVRFNASVLASADGISTAPRTGRCALHSPRRRILALVHGVLGAVLNGFALLPFAALGLNGLTGYEAECLDEALTAEHVQQVTSTGCLVTFKQEASLII